MPIFGAMGWGQFYWSHTGWVTGSRVLIKKAKWVRGKPKQSRSTMVPFSSCSFSPYPNKCAKVLLLPIDCVKSEFLGYLLDSALCSSFSGRLPALQALHLSENIPFGICTLLPGFFQMPGFGSVHFLRFGLCLLSSRLDPSILLSALLSLNASLGINLSATRPKGPLTW